MAAENEIAFVFSGTAESLEKTQDNLAGSADKLAKEYADAAREAQKAETSLRNFVGQMERVHSTPVEQLAAAESKLNQAVEKGMLTRERATTLLEAQREKLLGTKAAAEALDGSLKGFVAQLEQVHATPIERLADAESKLNQAVEKGLLTRERATTLLEAQREKLLGTTAAAERLEDSVRAFVTQLERTHATPIERLAEAETKLTQAVQLGIVSRQRANQLLDAHRAKLLASESTLGNALTKTQSALGVVGVTLSAAGAIQVGLSAINAGMRELNEQAEQAVDTFRKLEDPDTKLLQVSSSKEDLAQLRARAESVAPLVGDRAAARELVFAARSQGFEDDIETIAKSRVAIKTPSAIELASASKKFADTSVEQALNIGLSAAAGSKFDVESLTSQVFKAAEGAQQNKASAAETFAATAVLIGKFEQSTGDRLKVFLAKAAQDDKLKGLGLIEAFDQLQKLSPKKREAFLGESVELNAVASALAETIEPIRKLSAELEQARAKTGTSESILAQKIAIADTDPAISLRTAQTASEVRLEQARENTLALGKSREQTLLNQIDRVVADQTFMTRAAVAVTRGIVEWLPVSTETKVGTVLVAADVTRDRTGTARDDEFYNKLIAAGTFLESASTKLDAAAAALGAQNPDERRRLQLGGAF